jgi:hypothetical protein
MTVEAGGNAWTLGVGLQHLDRSRARAGRRRYLGFVVTFGIIFVGALSESSTFSGWTIVTFISPVWGCRIKDRWTGLSRGMTIPENITLLYCI